MKTKTSAIKSDSIMTTPASWLENHSKTCPFREEFGFDCLGCGFQRSLIELLNGNLVESFLLYPALIPILCLIFFFFIHLIFKINKGDKILKYLFYISASTVLISYAIKTACWVSHKAETRLIASLRRQILHLIKYFHLTISNERCSGFVIPSLNNLAFQIRKSKM